MDSIVYNKDMLMPSYAYLGSRQDLAGTNFPHQISDLEKAVERILRLNISGEEKRKILGENAAKPLKL